MFRQLLCVGTVLTLSGILSAAQPYTEFEQIRKNSSFCYEQYQLPDELRMLLTAADVARYQSFACAQEGDVLERCNALKALIADCPVPLGAHYVARKFAPATYDVVTQMSHQLKIETPLLFVALRGPAAHSMQMVCLGGGYHAVVIGVAFLRRRTFQECQAMMVYQLAQVSKKVKARAHIARIVWRVVAGIGSGLYLLYLCNKARKLPRGARFKPFFDAFFSWSGWLALLGTSWGVSELAHSFLKRRYRHQAHTAALDVFDGTPEEYAQCLKNTYKDQHTHAIQEYKSYRLYYDYVGSRIDELARSGVHDSIVSLFRNALTQQQEKHKTTPMPHTGDEPLLVEHLNMTRGPHE